jgi:glycosyltransferase involved in cell wall biosynthesis
MKKLTEIKKLIENIINEYLYENNENSKEIVFVRTKKFNNKGTINKLPYNGIQCWAIYENDLEKYIKELELWGVIRKILS